MKKVGLLLVLFILSSICFSQSAKYDFEPLDVQKVSNDIDTIKQQMDSTFYYINETYKILKEEVELFGLKKTIQINSGIFLPFIIFIGFYLLWLLVRNRKKFR